jgi:hypothetical protein
VRPTLRHSLTRSIADLSTGGSEEAPGVPGEAVRDLDCPCLLFTQVYNEMNDLVSDDNDACFARLLRSSRRFKGRSLSSTTATCTATLQRRELTSSLRRVYTLLPSGNARSLRYGIQVDLAIFVWDLRLILLRQLLMCHQLVLLREKETLHSTTRPLRKEAPDSNEKALPQRTCNPSSSTTPTTEPTGLTCRANSCTWILRLLR